MGDSYRPPPRHSDGGRGDAGFSFRGAADSYRPPGQNRPEERFTFNPPSGPSAPRFENQQPPPRGPQSNRSGANKKRDRGQGGRPQGRPPFRRQPRPAHARELLKNTDRETTPEQMPGMNTEGQMRYVDNTSDSEEGEDDDSSDSDSDSGSEEGEDDDQGATKRVKTNDEEPARPKWSNPDPYSALPPTDLGLQPKKDIVQTIRKAKVDGSSKKDDTNAVKENADFISFDFGDEQEDDEDMDERNDDQVGPPARSPVDLWMPTDMELAEMYMGADAGGKKRKRGLELHAPSHAGDIVTEWKQNRTNPTPWLKADPQFTSSSGLHRLHMEIVDFFNYVRPYPHEARVRNDLIDRIEHAVRNFQGQGGFSDDVSIKCFGSFASDLYLPVADMDLVAVSRAYTSHQRKVFCSTNSQKHKLAAHLERWGVPQKRTMVVIAKAKVPLIKFVDDRTGIKVDISFENDSGLTAIKTFMDWKDQYPEMPILVMVIKQFLAMRGLNEVFNGGIGGFTIICLVVSMLQLMPENQRKSLDMQARYGQLLLAFFDLYGNKFNIEETGIMMDPPGYFNKKQPGACNAKINATGLTIIDPNNDMNDISGGSKNVREVFKCFRGALSVVQRQLDKIRRGQSDTQSILGCILGGNYTSFEDQRDLLDRIDAAAGGPPPPRMFPPGPTQYPHPPPAQHPGQHPWQQYSQQLPPPARSGHYYHAAHNAHAFQQAGPPPLPPPPVQQPPQFMSGFQPLPARPPPGGYSQGPPPGNNPRQPKKGKKKANKAQNAPQNTNAGNAAKSKAQKKKEKKQKKQNQIQNGESAKAAEPQAKSKNKVKKNKKKETEQEKRENAKNARDQRAKKRLDTLAAMSHD